MSRGTSFMERRFPMPPEFERLASNWAGSATLALLGYLWKGCGEFTKGLLESAERKNEDTMLELSMNSMLFPYVQREVPKESPFFFVSKPDEMETRRADGTKPPEPDFGFVLWENHRIIWPIEAKVLKGDRKVKEYCAEVQNNFLTCRYGPFVSEGALLGYLLSGSPANAFATIAKKVPCELHDHPNFPDRNHKTSEHKRKVPEGKHYPSSFRCHHMILFVGRVNAL